MSETPNVEYTPYGETWIEKSDDYSNMLPYKFTAKELDDETGLYYYGARYLNPRTSRWISTDPALEDYLPVPPVDDKANKHNKNLPGMGGVFNPVNLNLYHYAGNNPVKFIDPDGRDTLYFGFTAAISIPFVSLINPDLPNQSSSTVGISYDTEDKSFGVYRVNSLGKSIIPDAQLGLEGGHSPLGADEYFSKSTSTSEASAIVSQSVVVDNESGDIVANEISVSTSALGKFFGKFFGSIANKFFGFDIAGRQDHSAYKEMIDLSKDGDN